MSQPNKKESKGNYVIMAVKQLLNRAIGKGHKTFLYFVRYGPRFPSVRDLIRRFELKLMAEGRKSQVILLDDRKLEFLIQPKLYTQDLLDLVASHYNIKEKEYFGLAFIDDTGHHNWLQLDRKVLDHDFPRRGQLTLYFLVRFFIESIAFLRDSATVETFYLQAKQSIIQSKVEADSATVFELAAHVLQATFGDYCDDHTTKNDLKKLPVIPVRTLEEHPSISYCDNEIISNYKKLAGLSRGSAIVNYMTIVESLPTYGIHYYEVKDKAGIPWWLGLSHRGISQYDYSDRKVPRRVFSWKQLENLYFRDKKFSIEVHDPKRVSVSRRTFGPSNVNVFAWFGSTSQLTKCIWSMAVSQHQFYLDRKQSKSTLPAVRSMSEIAADLSQSLPSLHSSQSDSISHCSSAASLSQSSGSKISIPQETEEFRTAQREMYKALKARKAALEDALKKKTEELKSLCMKEAEITGELPPETPLKPGEPLPQVRRRMGTAFTLSPKLIYQKDHEEDELGKLELDYELQKQIYSAAYKLAHDPKISKKLRKQRKGDYQRMHSKLKDVEEQVNSMRQKVGKAALSQPSVDDTGQIGRLKRDMSEGSLGPTDSESEFMSPGPSPAVEKRKVDTSKLDTIEVERPSTLANDRDPSTGSSQCSLSENLSPHSPSKQLVSRDSTPSPSRMYIGYTPSTIYQTRMQYRSQMYPTFSTRSHSVSSTQSDYENTKGSRPDSLQEAHNLYNLSSHRTSRYESSDMLESPNRDPVYRADPTSKRMSRHGSLECTFKGDDIPQDNRRYGSLERNFSYSGSTQKSMAEDFERLRMNRNYGSGDCHPQPVQSTPLVKEPLQDQLRPWYRPESPLDSPHYLTVNRNDAVDLSMDENYCSAVYDGQNNYNYDRSQGASPLLDRGQSPRLQPDHSSRMAGDVSPRLPHNAPHIQGQPFTTVTQYQHFREESKPYEMSDFYKYSEKLRRARLDKARGSPTPSQCSSNSSERTYMQPQYAHGIHLEAVSPGPEYAMQHPYPRGVGAPPPLAFSPTPSSLEDGGEKSPPTPGPVLIPQQQGQQQQQWNYSSQHSSQQSSPYQSPRMPHRQRYPVQAMTCDPVSEPLTNNRLNPAHYDTLSIDSMMPRSADTSFNIEHVSQGFSEEMLAWYQDREVTGSPKSATYI